MTTPHAVKADIITFTGDDEHLFDSLFEGWKDTLAVDQPGTPAPGIELARAGLQTPPHNSVPFFFAAVEGETVLGAALMFMPTADNTHYVHLEGWVNVDRRREGIGRALYAAVEEKARELGRTTIAFRGVEFAERESPSVRFAASVGMTSAMTEVCRRLSAEDFDDDVFAALRADCLARIEGYETLLWESGTSGPHPEEYVLGLAKLELRMDTDAPHGDMALNARTEPDPDGVRARSERHGLQGMRVFNAAVRHLETGDIAAWTAVALHPEGSFAYQNITVVDPAHRGRRFGTLVKLENLARIRAEVPRLRIIETCNAGENAHMIAINDAMGFKVFSQIHNYQKEI